MDKECNIQITNIHEYNKQPTLLVGLGGFGSRVVDNIYSRVKDKNTVSVFAIDTDIYGLHTLQNIPKQHIISMTQNYPLIEYLHYLSDAREWFQDKRLLFYKTLSEGTGQVRVISRVAYEIFLSEQRFTALLDEAYKVAKECVDNCCQMRVSIVTSLAGGTGSGIFIQVALLIREHINKHFPLLNVEIHGEFILPSNFLFLFANPNVERRHIEANTYAALKELNAINEHFFSDSVFVELKYGYEQNDDKKSYIKSLPYDYCFLYDRVNYGKCFEGRYIEDAIIERLFSESANDLNDKFVENLRLNIRKGAGNLYGTISTEKISLNSTILASEIFRSIINRTFTYKGRRIFEVCSPKKLNIDTEQFPRDTILVERIDSLASEITITELCFGIEISEIEKLKLGSGQYYKAYHDLIERIPTVITPHLNKNWHTELADIGESIDNVVAMNKIPKSLHKISKDAFVFISYSSREIEIANQLKYILETNGVPCWMAPQSIPAGSDYGKEIPKAIEKCKAFLLLLSDASQNSNWVPKEVGRAIGKGKIVVPFQIDNAAISDAFDFYLTNSQRISAYNRMSDAYQEVVKCLQDILGEL